MPEKKLSIVLVIQGIYLLLTGLWPLLDAGSFMQLTGPKTDVWLVKTVGLLTVAISIATIYLSGKGVSFIIGLPVALAFALIDFNYAISGAISKIYLIDGFVQALFIGILCYLKFRRRSGG